MQKRSGNPMKNQSYSHLINDACQPCICSYDHQTALSAKSEIGNEIIKMIWFANKKTAGESRRLN